MRLLIQSSLGEEFSVVVMRNATIADLKRKIQDRACNYLPDQQRLSFAGRQLEDGYRLLDYNIQPYSEIRLLLVPQPIGTINSSSYNNTTTTTTTRSRSDSLDPLRWYLMLPEQQRQAVAVPREELRRKARLEDTSHFGTFYFQPDCNILEDEVCTLLSNFLEYMWNNATASQRTDLSVVFPNDESFLQLVGALLDGDEDILHQLKLIYRDVPGASGYPPKIVLRMTVGPTNDCTDFHCDGGFVTSTSLIALNSPTEYVGGRLCYFVNDTLHVLERPKGSLVQHPPGILHGVSAMFEGTRKSLLVVDQQNGLGESNGGVVNITRQHVAGYISHMLSQGLSQQGGGSGGSSPQTHRVCVLCHEGQADHILIPCGHVVFCQFCGMKLPVDVCPLCRAGINDCIKAYF